jgi:hypothetical protein
MAFPTSPANNQFAIVNGIEYVWNATKGAWYRYGDATVNIITANTFQPLSNIVFSDSSIQTSAYNTSLQIYFSNTTGSSSYTTGAITINGGVGISGNIYSGGIISSSGNIISSGNIYSNGISSNTIVSASNIANNSVGYLGLPQNIVSLNYTLVITDSGKHIYMTQSANTGNLTIPQNSSVPFPVGTIITLVNSPSYSSNIVNTGTATLYVVANSTPRTSIQIGSFGIASLIKIASDTWYVSGSGIT